MRAVSCLEDDHDGADTLARLFLPEDMRAKLDNGAWREAVKERAGGIYPYIVARTRYFDRVFAECLSVGQVVLLGAGYDTRAYRFAERVREAGARVFELDAAPTQERKRAILAANGIDAGETQFVPMDFEHGAPLLGCIALLDGSSVAFIWEGVTLYLSPDAFERTLTAVRETSAYGVIAFDYLNVNPAEWNAKVTRKDEQLRFGMGMDAMEEYMRSMGFGVVENLGGLGGKETMSVIRAEWGVVYS
jgi:methyltransferase (TIGR00027 family)